jgi:PAS domain S-box-containing protein
MNKKSSEDKKKQSSSVKPPDYYLNFLENSQDALYSLNSQTGQFDYMSSAVTAILGFTPREVIKMGTEGLNQRIPPEHRPKMDKFASDSKKRNCPNIAFLMWKQNLNTKKGIMSGWVSIESS